MTKSEAQKAYNEAKAAWQKAKQSVEPSEGMDVEQSMTIKKLWDKVIATKKVLNEAKD